MSESARDRMGRYLRRSLPGIVFQPLRVGFRGFMLVTGWIVYHSRLKDAYLTAAVVKNQRSLLEEAMVVYFFGHRFYRDVPRYRREIIGLSPAGDAWTETYRSRRSARSPSQAREQLADLIRLVSAMGPRKVLQIGCGAGGYLALLAEDYPEVHFLGLDPNAHIIRQNARDFAGLGGHPKPAICGHLKTGHMKAA